MMIGDPSLFAIESGITHTYESLGLRALGFFVLHVGGHRYGVHSPDATMLANSFDKVGERLVHRGEHTAPFATDADAGRIADAFRKSVYADEKDKSYFGIPQSEFRKLFYIGTIDRMMAPDGDAAFDDGSYVLQFDIGDRVRVIAFRCGQDGLHAPATLSDVWLAVDDFYNVLQQWHDAFRAEWESSPRVADSDGTYGGRERGRT